MRVSVIADFSDSYNRAIFLGAASFGRQQGWELEQIQPHDVQHVIDAVHHSQALLLGSHPYESHNILARRTLPTVGWSATLAEVNWPRVLPDDFAVGQSVATHFLSLGLKHFAFYSDLTGIWVDRRREGFVAGIEAAGAQPHIVQLPRPAQEVHDIAVHLQSLPRPLGMMLVHDGAAFKVLAACRSLNWLVPSDIALVGVDDDDRVVNVIMPSLSSVPLQSHQIGFEAAALLAQIISKPARKPWSILVPPGEIIVRQSSDLFSHVDGQVGLALRFIRDHLAHGVETKQVVAHIGVCRTTLNAKFVSQLGRSVAEEIRRARIEHCRHLLSTTDKPMTQVAAETGFSTARQLSVSFSRLVGMPPTRFREQFRKSPLQH